MASRFKICLFSVVLISLCLFNIAAADYGVSYPQSPSPAYAPPTPYYEKPSYYETYDTQVDYREANASRQCGILPAVHRNEYGYERERLAFGEYPWLVSVMDSYQVYLAAGAIISPRHILTSAKAIHGKSEADLLVRIGDYDMMSDHNYLEAYRNYEIAVSKIYHYSAVHKSAAYGSQYQQSYDQYNYDAAILELYEDIDFDLYPQAEPVCLPEYYYRSKTYYAEKTYSYGSGSQSQQQEVPSNSQPQQKTQIGVNADLTCWVAGWRESPLEKISYEQEKEQSQSGGNSGYSYKPSTYYDYYEQSRTPRKAKVSKVYEYEGYTPSKSNSGSYGYDKPYKTENWIAEYYYDACHADQGSPIFCLVPAKYEQEYEKYYSPPAYQPEYKPEYKPEYTPSYPEPSYKPDYQPSYQPSYQPAYQSSYQPSYPSSRVKRGADYYPSPPQAPYQPSYPTPTPSYPQQTYQKPSYQPSYQPSPSYQPTYHAPPYKFPTIPAEKQIDDYRRAVVVGIVSYGTECTYTPYTETKKITVTPVKDILDWILYVILSHGV